MIDLQVISLIFFTGNASSCTSNLLSEPHIITQFQDLPQVDMQLYHDFVHVGPIAMGSHSISLWILGTPPVSWSNLAFSSNNMDGI